MVGAFAAGAWLGGMVAADALGGSFAVAGAVILGLLAAGAAVQSSGRGSRRLMLIGAVFTALALAGAARYDTGQPHPERSGLARFNDGQPPITLQAAVAAPPEERGANTQLRLEARALVVDGDARPIDGKLLAVVPPGVRYRYGDLLELRGRPQTPPSFDDFDYREYLARQGIGSRMSYPRVERIGETGNPLLARLFELRTYLADRLARELPEPEAGLAQGMTLGERRAIAPDLRDDLNATGTSHLVVISGQNVAILAALLTVGLAWLVGRRQAGVLALVVVALYTVMAGADPPVVRGAIMGGAWTFATLLGRRASAPITLLLAAALMAAQNPAIIDDASFRLSFAATAGLVLLAGPLASCAKARLRIPDAPPGPASALIDAAAVTAAATLATLPLIALDFGRVSLISLPANLLMVPLFPVILAASSATAALSALWPPLAAVAAPFAWLSLTAMVRLGHALAAVPLASAQIDGVRPWHVLVAYGLLPTFAWWLHRQPRASAPLEERTASPRSKMRDVYAMLAGAATALALLAALAARPGGSGGRFDVRFLDVGQGDAALLRSPSGRTVLIDGGTDGALLARRLGEALPPRDRSLDLIVATHSDSDHVSGLVETLRRFDVGGLLASERGQGTPYAALLAEAARRGVPVRIGHAGERFEFDGATLEVLAPTDAQRGSENDAGLALRLRYGSAEVLFASDLEAAGEAALVRAFPSADVLKVAHHGSRTSSTQAFLDAVGAQVAVVSVGESNRYGHPNAGVMAGLEARSARVYRTDRDGTVTLTTDGRRLWLRGDR